MKKIDTIFCFHLHFILVVFEKLIGFYMFLVVILGGIYNNNKNKNNLFLKLHYYEMIFLLTFMEEKCDMLEGNICFSLGCIENI